MKRSTKEIEDVSILVSGRPSRLFLAADQFVSPATSRIKLFRDDEPARGVLGLVNPATGDRLLIEATSLLAP